MKKMFLVVLIFLLAITISSGQSQATVKIDPRISLDSLMSDLYSDIDIRINNNNFEIVESLPYIVEVKCFYFNSNISKDSIIKSMNEVGFEPANFLETVIIISMLPDLTTFPILSFGASYRSTISDNDFVLCVNESIWGYEASLVPQYFGKRWKKSNYFLGVKREFIK